MVNDFYQVSEPINNIQGLTLSVFFNLEQHLFDTNNLLTNNSTVCLHWFVFMKYLIIVCKC